MSMKLRTPHPSPSGGPDGRLQLAFSRPVVVRALKVAALVGTLLALINHGDSLLAGSLSGEALAKVLLTYLVPYGVSVWSAVSALQASRDSH